MKPNLMERLNGYTRLAKGLAKPLLAGAAALTATDATAGIVYSGTLNTVINEGDAITLNLDGGANDFKLEVIGSGTSLQEVGRVQFLQAGQRFGNGNFLLSSTGDYAVLHTLLNSSNNVNSVNINQTMNNNGFLGLFNEFANDGAFLNVIGQPRFVGFRLASGNYGWMRISVGTDHASMTLVDWAYEDSGAGIAPIMGSLPVELIAIRAQTRSNAVRLFWTTASEENNAGFEVQRSTDGKAFESLGFVKGNGTTFEAQDYFFDDKTVRPNQTYYYRLKQVDYDGRFEFSTIVTAVIEGKTIEKTHFYPNPTVNGVTKLDYTSADGGVLKVAVYNLNGQMLAQWTRSIGSGLNVLEFDFSNLSKGSYFVKLESGNDRQYQKLMVQ